jgi:hypothetical protein
MGSKSGPRNHASNASSSSRPLAPTWKERSYFVTLFAFVCLLLGYAPLLLKRGVCCKSLIRRRYVTKLPFCKPLVVGSIPTAGTNASRSVLVTWVSCPIQALKRRSRRLRGWLSAGPAGPLPRAAAHWGCAHPQSSSADAVMIPTLTQVKAACAKQCTNSIRAARH